MVLAQWHTCQVLTKRGDRLNQMLRGPLQFAADVKNIWWGVSVENKRDGVPRIKQLQNAPAAVRFLSVEPLLEDVGKLNLKGISWVIVGGESGPHSRPMQAEWVRSLREQCETSGVAFFFKQWGGARKKLTGRTLDGKTYSEFPTRHELQILPEPQRVLHIQKYSSLPMIDVPLEALSA
jgi:protein gp37